MEGRIAVYDNSTGNGIILLSNKEKFNFSIENWDSNSVPTVGLQVSISNENKIIVLEEAIVSSKNESPPEIINLMEINFSKIGFKITQSSNNILEVLKEGKSEKNFSVFMFLVHTIWISLALSLIFGILSIIPAVIIAVMISKRTDIIEEREHILIRERNGIYTCTMNGKIVDIDIDFEGNEVKINHSSKQSNNEIEYAINRNGIEVIY